MNQVIETMLNHRSIRSYEDRPVEQEKLDAILNCFQQAPNWMNFQLCSAVVIKDRETREKLASLSGQPQVAQAPVFIVLCGDFHRVEIAARKHGVDIGPALRYVDEAIVCGHEAGIASEAITVAAESLGLGTVIIGAIRRAPMEVIKLLNLPKYVVPILGICVGYAASNPDLKPRLPREAAVFEERYGENLEKVIDQYDENYGNYHMTRSSNQKKETWSDQISAYYAQPKERHTAVAQMLNEQGFSDR